MKKPVAKLIGQNGNIFNLSAIAANSLRNSGLSENIPLMNERISQSCSYDEALNVISEFVKIE
jgi:hypothetical protein